MTSPVAPRFNYGVSASPGSRFAGTMPSPTQSPSSRLTIPNGQPLSPRLYKALGQVKSLRTTFGMFFGIKSNITPLALLLWTSPYSAPRV
jgi:hypothetical protein